MKYPTMHDDRSPQPSVENVRHLARNNCNFRQEIWTGCHMQMTIMAIPPCGDIGQEIHNETDQMIRVEEGCGMAVFGKCDRCPDAQMRLKPGDVVFVPAGTRHNIKNIGSTTMKLSSVYAPPKHPKGTVHRTKEDAMRAE